jgi:hypothetical protein
MKPVAHSEEINIHLTGFISRITSVKEMLYLHEIYTSCPEFQKTKRIGTEWDTLLVDVEFIISLNNNTYTTTKEKTTIIRASKESGLEDRAKIAKSILIFSH